LVSSLISSVMKLSSGHGPVCSHNRILPTLMRLILLMSLSKDANNIGIVVEGTKVLTALGNFPRVNLAYPKELRYTFKAIQKFLLELDCSKLSPRIIVLLKIYSIILCVTLLP
uniref:Uncharacterized protein n=1 Tax=Seriola lalandi dorsalis TaxID=1841481 RepID=A0A3B4YHU8_SERLL